MVFKIIPSSVVVEELDNVSASIVVRLASISGVLTFPISIDLQTVEGTARGEFHTLMVDLCCMCTSTFYILQIMNILSQGWRKQICIGQAKQNVGRRFSSKPENCLSLLNFLFNQYFIVDK